MVLFDSLRTIVADHNIKDHVLQLFGISAIQLERYEQVPSIPRFDSMPVIVDLDGSLLHFNQRQEEILDYPSSAGFQELLATSEDHIVPSSGRFEPVDSS